MNNVLIIAILVLICFKWIVIAFVFPFQAAYGKYKSAQSNFYKVLALPYWLLEKFMRGGWERYMIFQVGHIPSCHLRKLVYRGLGVKADNNVVFHFDTEIRRPWLLRLGHGTIIGDHAILDARNGITMGENVNLSSNVSIYTEQHDHRDPYFGLTKGGKKSVNIGNRVWLGSNVVVLPGVTIGEGAVCCAGAVITKDVAPYSVVAGIPAKEVNQRPEELHYVFKSKDSCRLY